MSQKIKRSFLQTLFSIFSFLADKTNGNTLFVRPKLALGVLILGLTACNNAQKTASSVTCYEPAAAPDSVQTVDTNEVPIMSTTICYFTEPVLLEPVIPKDTTNIISTCYITLEDVVEDSIELPPDTNQIYIGVEQPPEFEGGIDEGLMKIISDSLRYPITGDCITGTTVVRFVVEKDGTITNPELLRGFDDWSDKEAIRVINLLPKFIKPAMQNGTPVRCYFTVPVKFKI